MSATTTTASEYARVSKDKSGRLRSVTEQTYENRDAALDNGWTWLPTTYAEDGEASASVFGKVARVGFQTLLDDMRTGTFPADVLVLWEASRGSRQMREWVDLIDALAAASVRVHITSEDRTYDVRKPKDRRDLQDAANEAEYYSGRLSTTLKRAHRSGAREGHWNGIAPFGYKRVWSPDGEVSQLPDETTAPFVREAYEHVAGGGSIAGLVTRWNDTGVTGRRWSTQALRVVLLNPAYTGIRVHTPRSRHESRSATAARGRTSTEHPGAWPAIVDTATADRVRVLITDPARLKHRSTGVAHLLSNIVGCGSCESPLQARNAKSPAYRCPKGCVQISEADLDDLVTTVLISYLQRDEIGPPADDESAPLIAARAEVAAAEAYLREVEQAADSGLSPLLVAKMQTQGEARLQAANTEVRRLSLPSALGSAMPLEPMTRAAWDAMPLAAQRRLVRILYGKDGIAGPVRVKAGARGRRVPTHERVTFGPEA